MSAWMGQARSRLPRLAEDAVERARLTVVPRRPQRTPRMPFMVLVATVLLGGVVGLLLFNTHMQTGSFRATALEQQVDALHAKEQSLRMELDQLREPQRVATRAQELGMVPITNPAFLRLSDGKVLGDAVPASAEDGQRLDPLPPQRPGDLETGDESVQREVIRTQTPDTSVDGVPSDTPDE
jgi:hypothetical protein